MVGVTKGLELIKLTQIKLKKTLIMSKIIHGF